MKNKAGKPSLPEQCAALQWPLERLACVRYGLRRWGLEHGDGHGVAPEELVAQKLRGCGAKVSWCEGGSFNLLMKAACLELLAARNIFNDRQDTRRRFFEAQCAILRAQQDDIVEAVRACSADEVARNIDELCSDRFVRESYPNVTPEFLKSLYRATGAQLLARITQVFAADPYAHRAGWPDLTVIVEAQVRFVEVKTTDKLHESQLRFARAIAAPLGFDCRVVQVL